MSGLQAIVFDLGNVLICVDEARAIRARAIVLPLPPRRAGFPVFSRTLETVLAERPARVIIESEPLHEPAARAA